jgi:GAF domain-containing protein
VAGGVIEIGLESPEKLDPEERTIRGQVQHAKFVQREKIKAFVGISLRAFEQKLDSDAVQDEEEVGILYLNFRTPRQFTQEELRTIRIYAHQVANFTRGNRLLVRAQRQANELEAVRQTAIKILAQESLEALLKALVQEATRLLKGKGGKVYIRVPGKEQVQLLAAENVDHVIQPLGYVLNFGEGLAGRVMQTKKPQIVQDYSQWEYRLEALTHLFGAVIEVPLLRGEEAIGVLAVFDEVGKQRFTEEDYPILERLAQQAALAIHNASLVEQERALRQQAETLQEVSSAISANLDLGEAANRILDELGQVIAYDKATIQRIQGDQRELLAHRGFTEEQIDHWLLRPVSQDGLVHRIVSSQEPLILNNLLEDAPDEWEIRKETADIKSWVGLPLVYGGEAIGFMTLDRHQPGFYTQAHKNLLTLFANQAAVAIQNALLYEESQRRIRDLEIVGEIARVIGVKLELNELFRAIAVQIVEHLACAHCTVFMPEYENGRLLLVPKATYGQDGEKIRSRRFAPGKGVAGWVYLNGESKLIKNAAKDPTFTLFSQHNSLTRSLLVVPIKSEGKTIGVLSADQDEFDWFDEQDQQLVETLVRHVAMAIQNAQFVRRERAIREVASAISANLQMVEVSERILDALHRIIEYHNAGIQLVEGDVRRQIAFRSHTGQTPDMGLIRPIHEDPLILPVLTNQKPHIISNATSDHRFAQNIGSWVCVPLIYGLETIGTMTLDHRQPNFYTEEMKEVLSLFGDQAAIAIQNVLYFEKLQQPVVELQRSREAQIAAIGEIARSIAGRADLPTVLNAILDSTRSLIRGVRLLEIHLLDTATDELVLQAFRGPAIREEFQRMSTEVGIVGWVFRNKQSQIVADVREDERYKEILKETRSELVIPLLQQGEVIGVLNIEHPQVNAFTAKDKQLAEGIASLIVVAMQNAQQYQQLKKSELQLKLLQEISLRISTNLFSLHEVLELVVENLRKIFTEAHCVIRLYDATASTFDKPITASFFQDAERIQDFAPRHNGISRYVVETGEPYFVENANVVSHHGKPKINKNLIRQGIRSSASLPLQIENQVIGVLYLNLKTAHKFSESEGKILSLFADQAAIAVWKIQQTHRRIEAVRAKFNPYIVGAPILKTEGFFGRKHFLEDILGSVHNNHFLIYGERRIGKTSLLYQLDYLLGSTVDPKYRFIPVVCSLEGISANQFFGFLIKQIVDSIPGTKINFRRKSNTNYNHLAFEEDFKKVVEYLQREIPDKDVRVVLLLDEMDQFLGYEHAIHQRFRSLLTTPISLFLKVIMFGVHIQRMHQTLTSPWYNLFKELELQRLKKSEARQLLIEYVRSYYSYEPEALKLILKYSDLKPLQVQRLGYYSVKSMLERNESLENLGHLEAASDSSMLILRDDVTRSVDLILGEKTTEYQELWERFDEQQREMLAQAARKSGEIDISATQSNKFLSLLGQEDWQHAPPIYEKNNRAIRLANLFAEWVRRFK